MICLFPGTAWGQNQQLALFMASPHQEFSLLFRKTQLTVCSNFDSGNIGGVYQLQDAIVAVPVFDPFNAQYSSRQSTKTFFHFSVSAAQPVEVPFVIHNMKILQYFASESIFSEYFRVCVKRVCPRGPQKGNYQKEKLKGMRRVIQQNSCQLHFTIDLVPNETVFLAYSFPYPYARYREMISDMQQNIKQSNEHQIYFVNELLIDTNESRAVNLITLSSHSGKTIMREPRVSKSIFPLHDIEDRPHKFSKPYIFVTCRVHSGQTSSSFALEGMLKYLVSNTEKAVLLRKLFVFVIVPMLNPDGVFHGTYRMDPFGHNLNRFYNSAQSHKQPAIFAVQTLAQSYGQRLVMSIDLHGHPHPQRGSFIYGNAVTTIEEQVEAQLFAKLLAGNSESFSYEACSFAQHQMKSKDAYETLTKEGSARVQFYKALGLTMSFTFELGCHGAPLKLPRQSMFRTGYRRENRIFTELDYQEEGQAILESLLQMFISNVLLDRGTLKKECFLVREGIARELIEKQDRFRTSNESQVRTKLLGLNERRMREISRLSPSFCAEIMAYVEANHPQLVTFPKIKDGKGKKESIQSIPPPGVLETLQAVPHKIQSASKLAKASSGSTPVEFSSYPFDIEYSKDFHFAKLLNLNFNPFPMTERNHLYLPQQPSGDPEEVLSMHQMRFLSRMERPSSANKREQGNSLPSGNIYAELYPKTKKLRMLPKMKTKKQSMAGEGYSIELKMHEQNQGKYQFKEEGMTRRMFRGVIKKKIK